MYYGEIKTNDIANGEGIRTSLFVSGCRNACENCFNRETWAFDYGNVFTDETAEYIIENCEKSWINGLSVLGGEPFEPENQHELLVFLKTFRKRLPQKTVWCYTGFTFEELIGQQKSRGNISITKELLKQIDVLVDGRFVEEKKDISLAFKGSSNQRIIDIKRTLQNEEVILYIK